MTNGKKIAVAFLALLAICGVVFVLAYVWFPGALRYRVYDASWGKDRIIGIGYVASSGSRHEFPPNPRYASLSASDVDGMKKLLRAGDRRIGCDRFQIDGNSKKTFFAYGGHTLEVGEMRDCALTPELRPIWNNQGLTGDEADFVRSFFGKM